MMVVLACGYNDGGLDAMNIAMISLISCTHIG
jgi:hypothetical protein